MYCSEKRREELRQRAEITRHLVEDTLAMLGAVEPGKRSMLATCEVIVQVIDSSGVSKIDKLRDIRRIAVLAAGRDEPVMDA
jgi:hypothetical protein